MKRLIPLFLTAMLLFALCSCGPQKGAGQSDTQTKTQETLSITYLNTKYGDDWIKAAAAAFMKANPTVKVVLTGDSKIDSTVDSRLQSGAGLPDLVFVSKANWRYWAGQGWIADLSDVYSARADGKTVEDKLWPELKTGCSTGGHYYIYPWGDGVTGFLYNASLFSKHGWQVPTTVQELSTLIASMKEAGITPFAWSGQDMSAWDEAVTGWWAQYEGEENMQTYLAMESPDVYAQNGRLAALQEFSSLLSDAGNSVPSPVTTGVKSALEAFYAGTAAMLPGSYVVRMNTVQQPPDGFDARVMALPAVEGAQSGNLAVSLSGDFAVVPASAKQAALAKKFLVFLTKDSLLRQFTQETGMPAAFETDLQNIANLSTLAKSEISLWQQSSRLYMISQSTRYNASLMDWPGKGSPLIQIYYGNTTPQLAFEQAYAYAKSNWDTVQ